MLALHASRLGRMIGLMGLPPQQPLKAAAILFSIVGGSTAAWASSPTPFPPAGTPLMSPREIEADGTVNVPSFRLPPSPYLSPEARAALPRSSFDPEEAVRTAVANGTAAQIRAGIAESMAPRARRLMERYPVTVTDTTIAGLPAVVVRPVSPMPEGNAHKIMINLPGGAFAQRLGEPVSWNRSRWP